MYRIAKLYYLENLNQSEIAKRVGLSRPQISRYLKKARETGMVHVKIHEPVELSKKDIEMKLETMLGLKDVVIGSVNPGSSPDDKVIEIISSTASDYLPRIINKSKNVGLGWGRTVYSTVLSMDYHNDNNMRNFIPLIGGIGQKEPYYQVNTLIDRLGEKFNGKRFFLNAPAFINHSESYRNVLISENYNSVFKQWKNLDLAIVGLGAPINFSKVLQSEIDAEIIGELKKLNAIGDMIGQFFDKYGNICKTDMEKSIIGLRIEKLKEIKNVVCLSGGKEKARGIIAGARAGFFNILITDYMTANQIINILEDD